MLVKNGYFLNHIGISIATSYASNAADGIPIKHAEVRDSVFETMDLQTATDWPPESISMNWGMTPRDSEPRDPIDVYDYNGEPGYNFKVYYSYEAPRDTAPCHDTAPNIGGWVCQ